MPNTQIERLRSLPIRRTAEVWEVGASPMPAMAPVEEGGGPEQLVACVYVSSKGGAAMAEPQTARAFDVSAGLRALRRFALDPLVPGAAPLNYLPAKVHVGPMPEEAQRAIVSALMDVGVVVEIKDDFMLTVEFFDGLAAHLSGVDEPGGAPLMSVPPLIRVKGMSVERVGAFADAARSFWTAAPWRLFDGEIVWRIEPAPKVRALRHCTVMGGGGEEFGLAFLADPMLMLAMGAAEHPADYWESRGDTHWCVTFDPTDEAPTADALLWQDRHLALAASEAFPVPLGVTASGRAQRPSPANLTLMEGLLRAFAELKPVEIKTGGFTREVSTFEGVRTLTLQAAMGL